MRTQLFNQHGFAMLMPAVSFAMNTLALTVYWVGASIVEKVALTDVAARIATFGDIMVFGTYATYVIMSIMMMVMIVMFFPSAQVSAGRINEVLNAKSPYGKENRTTLPKWAQSSSRMFPSTIPPRIRMYWKTSALR